MSTDPSPVTYVALIGNPNTGKSTLFTALAGVRQKTGNYPGVTVEKKTGHFKIDGRPFALIDLPGTYSLAPRSLDEMVTVDVLLGRQTGEPVPKIVLCIVDASNLERNLYLASQVLSLGIPMILALNMSDVAEQRGIKINLAELEKRLGVPVIKVQANRNLGIDQVRAAIARIDLKNSVEPLQVLPVAFYESVQRLMPLSRSPSGEAWPEYYVERLLLDKDGYLEQALNNPQSKNHHPQLLAALTSEREKLVTVGCTIPHIEAISRYQWIGKQLNGVIEHPEKRPVSVSDEMDSILTHRFWGLLIFAILMLTMFTSIFMVAPIFMDVISSVSDAVGDWVGSKMTPGPLQSLVTDGIIGGVGGVVVFLPQIMMLFMFIAILEDCGYMARAAFLMDKLMSKLGLSGKSFIPMLSSFACAIPGIMSTRVIENRRDRFTTIMVAPLMSCSARLPVYLLLIAAFIPQVYYFNFLPLQALILFLMYLVGAIVAVIVAFLLKKTLLKGETPPFVLELPAYKIPSVKIVLLRMISQGWAFLYRAGTLILAVSIIVWALLYYPHGHGDKSDFVAQEIAKQKAELERQTNPLLLKIGPEDSEEATKQLARFNDPDELEKIQRGIAEQNSYLGQMGKAIEPAVRPLGWDWRIGAAAIASFPAREVVIGTLGVIYNLGEIDTGDAEQKNVLIHQLQEAKWDNSERKVYTIPVALSIMVFFALCAQCVSTLVIIKRETNSWAWPAFTFVYMTVLAYIGAFATFRIGTWLIG
jgi:ferrous iron transport protein B